MKGINYPAQTGTYTVKVKNGAIWRDYKVARLQISVGSDRHEGEKFKATVEWLKHRFDKVIVCVNDTIQRFNYMTHGFSEEEALRCSMAVGREWISRHMDEIRSLPNVEIYRWEEWKGPAFEKAHQNILELYDGSPEFREAMGESQKNSYSREYLLEEIAVFSLMYQKEKAVDVYPGTLPKVMSVFQDQHTTRIDFMRKKAA